MVWIAVTQDSERARQLPRTNPKHSDEFDFLGGDDEERNENDFFDCNSLPRRRFSCSSATSLPFARPPSTLPRRGWRREHRRATSDSTVHSAIFNDQLLPSPVIPLPPHPSSYKLVIPTGLSRSVGYRLFADFVPVFNHPWAKIWLPRSPERL
ncbi:hypothetical protein CAPTEDRAFT_206550 [Capitella teleta]|uniref:Uncharacterized protein n=1 Tax=Capitella teleta TaxID=283909 RepID=R7T5B8_CAPTE|nr:hypothetical protein CAPTEDRAFT_206550 [Capitella teleta]|eukprot:ELT88293.1 hypothetical protein CAPTEDRAFT_206550 [Capitella teleta]